MLSSSRSPSSSRGRRFTIGRPLEWRPATGMRYAFSWYTRPRSVKKRMLLCVMVTNMSTTCSSSFVSIPSSPWPPRCCFL